MNSTDSFIAWMTGIVAVFLLLWRCLDMEAASHSAASPPDKDDRNRDGCNGKTHEQGQDGGK